MDTCRFGKSLERRDDMKENEEATADWTSWYPMSDSGIYLADKKATYHQKQPVRTIMKSYRRPPITTTSANRKPMQSMTNTTNAGLGKRVLLWTATGATATAQCIKMPMGQGKDDGKRCKGQIPSSPTVYTYSIINQRLSHNPAFSPSRVAATAQSAPIAYKFVFTNTL